jgi:hypothetical protein
MLDGTMGDTTAGSRHCLYKYTNKLLHPGWVVSPTGFEPVLLAPEASALSRLSYGDTEWNPIIKRPPRTGQELATYLTNFVTGVTPLIDGPP